MRVFQQQGDFQARAIAGTHTVLIALDCAESRRRGLLGFAIRREVVEAVIPNAKWLKSKKVFKSVVPHPETARDPNDPPRPQRFSTLEHPVQSFLWGDYTAQPNTRYRFTVVPMYGRPGALEPAPAIEFEVRTEKEFDQGHGVWFNRGAIASQAFADEFQNKAPSNPNDPHHRETAWLSRGLLEACLRYINETPAGDGLRVAAYEFTYRPILEALKNALERGVNVRIVYHDTTKEAGSEKGENEAAIASAALPSTFNNTQVLFPRTRTKIPHNKFIVRLQGGATPVSVWTGSTNFTPSGFLGQTNVGHLVEDAATAKQYLSYWELLKTDPNLEDARNGVLAHTPNPPELIPANSTARAFSPRHQADLLNWYARRIKNSEQSVMFTAAFGVAEQLIPALANDKGPIRFLLMEKPPADAVKARLSQNHDLLVSYGAVLGEMYEFKNGAPVARRKIKEFDLEKWFLKEELFRKTNEGFVFFVHTKFLLIDPLSDDPLVCSGSANFSSNSLLQNDENMLLIRGNTRVADIYLTEFDRIFRHFYFRDVANEIEARGGQAEGAFLDETDHWTDSYFLPGGFKTRRRQMFFSASTKTWAQNAALDQPDPPKKSSRPAPVAAPPLKTSSKTVSPKKAAKNAAVKVIKQAVTRKASPKQALVKKSAAQKSAAKKSSAQNAASKKAAVKKSTVKKSAVKKPVAKKLINKSPAKKTPIKKVTVKKVLVKKGVSATSTKVKKVVAKKPVAAKTTVKKLVANKSSQKKTATGKPISPKRVVKKTGVKKGSRK